MKLNQIINAYKAGIAVSKTELSTLTEVEHQEFANRLLVDEELFLRAMPACFRNSPTLSRKIKSIPNWREKYSNLILKNNDIFKKLIPNIFFLGEVCDIFPEKSAVLIAKYSLLHESINKIVDRIGDISEIKRCLSEDYKFWHGHDYVANLNRMMEEKCCLLISLNEKLKDIYQKPAKTQEEKDQIKKFRDQIIDLEESFPMLKENKEWQAEKAKFLDFFNWRCSSLVNTTVAFLREKYPATTLNLIEKVMVPTDLRQKLEAPTVNQTFKAQIN